MGEQRREKGGGETAACEQSCGFEECSGGQQQAPYGTCVNSKREWVFEKRPEYPNLVCTMLCAQQRLTRSKPTEMNEPLPNSNNQVGKAKTATFSARGRKTSLAIDVKESPAVVLARKTLANENSIYLQSIYESVQTGYRTQMVGRAASWQNLMQLYLSHPPT